MRIAMSFLLYLAFFFRPLMVMESGTQWLVTFGLFSLPIALAYHNWISPSVLYVYLSLLILIAIVFPVIFNASLYIQRGVLYFYFLDRPNNEDLKYPEKFGLAKATNFYIQNEEISLGVWHWAPDEKEGNFEKSLGDGSPLVLYIHGNSGSRASDHRIQLYQILHRLHYHVLSFDYRCFGDSTYGTPHEKALASDSMAVAKWVIKRCGSTPVYLYGHSLGTGLTTNIAAQLFAEGYYVRGVILESPFTDMPSEIKIHPLGTVFRLFPWYNFLFSRPYETNGEDFRSAVYIQKFASPILILHAEDDGIIPSILGKELYLLGQETRSSEYGPMVLHLFAAHRKLGHTRICDAPEIPNILRNFIESHKNKEYRIIRN